MIMRRVDDLGRISLPKEIRSALKIREGDSLELSVEGDTICVRKHIVPEEYITVLKHLSADVSGESYFDKEQKQKILTALNDAIGAIAKKGDFE